MNDMSEIRSDVVDAAVAAAAAVADEWAASSGATRARLLRALADALEAQRAELVALADRDTSLGAVRLNGEIDRTAFQLRGFAERVEAGAAFALTDDPAMAGAPPAGRPRLAKVRVPVGPVAMFSASNFPFAFSVLGGDTASALAAGCPVVVKAHRGHLELSRAVAALARDVIARLVLPAGLFGMVEGAGNAVGVALVQHPDIAAAAFTGSFQGGRALEAAAQARPVPIPFYGELGSINPVLALPAALAERGEELAKTLAASIAQGCGQFCTSPGIVLLWPTPASDAFLATLGTALAAQTPHAMLTAGMRANFDAGVARLAAVEGVQPLLDSSACGDGSNAAPRPFLACTSAATFIARHALREEVFGPACLAVRVRSDDEAIAVLRAVGGSLTVTVWGAEADTPAHRRLVRAAAQVAGRVLFAGVPTGVAVTAAQQHGGPFPSSTQPFTTSVGFDAMDRFLRPVALQDAPAWLVERKGQPC
jgi:NADP-dependent aldehyde dehydrogenase